MRRRRRRRRDARSTRPEHALRRRGALPVLPGRRRARRRERVAGRALDARHQVGGAESRRRRTRGRRRRRRARSDRPDRSGRSRAKEEVPLRARLGDARADQGRGVRGSNRGGDGAVAGVRAEIRDGRIRLLRERRVPARAADPRNAGGGRRAGAADADAGVGAQAADALRAHLLPARGQDRRARDAAAEIPYVYERDSRVGRRRRSAKPYSLRRVRQRFP